MSFDFVFILIIFNAIVCSLNFLILFFVSAFLVRFRNDIVQLFSSSYGVQQTSAPADRSPIVDKTWDQKYEDELEFISNRIRQNSDGGL